MRKVSENYILIDKNLKYLVVKRVLHKELPNFKIHQFINYSKYKHEICECL